MRSIIRAALLAWTSTLSLAATAVQAAPVPLSAFFDNPAMGAAQLSPDGRHVAATFAHPSGRVYLVVIDAATRKASVTASYSDADVSYFHWISDDRLVYTLTDYREAGGDISAWPGLLAVNRDGGERVYLIGRANGRDTDRVTPRANLPHRTHLAGEWGAQDSEYVYVQDYGALYRLNSLTGKFSSIDRPRNNDDWLLDRQGVPRIAFASTGNQYSIHYRDSATQPWEQLTTIEGLAVAQGGFTPRFFGPDGDLYVTTHRSDESALFRYDFSKRTISEKPVFSTPGYDFSGTMITDDTKILGFSYEVDAKGIYWIDEHMKQVQKAVDAALPGTNNMIEVPRRPQSPYVLVTSASDVQPPAFSLFDMESGKLYVLGRSRPAIAAARMAPKIMVRYPARDGLEIPAYLTLPAVNGGKQLPLVVLVHGGPYVRGVGWEWEADSQFLASRGYAVLEPEFRGSTGFGLKHFMAGWKQWGLKMQDDIADGTRWAIAQGYADPKRICIAGASYGGYATLMGLINDADLYKCGINWLGVTDIPLWNKGHWSGDSDMGDIYRKYGFPVLLGDLEQDAAQFKATSPLQQAARITQPLLLAYGEMDQRVPPIHGTLFRDAVRKTNPNVEWVLYGEEAHGWRLPKNRIDFWTRVEKFLDKNIGKP